MVISISHQTKSPDILSYRDTVIQAYCTSLDLGLYSNLVLLISKPYNVIIPAGQTHIKFNISVVDDNVPEDDKFFALSIVCCTSVQG